MGNAQIATGGLILIFLAGLGYVYPLADNGMTIPEINDLCASGLGQLGQTFSGDVQKICREYGYLMYGIYGFGLIGLILLVVGAVIPGQREIVTTRTVEETEEDDSAIDLLKKRYAKGEITKEEFEQMKKDLENS